MVQGVTDMTDVAEVTAEDLGWDDRSELYAVACIHCEGIVFRFSNNYLSDHGEVTLICPGCGGLTRVTEDGDIRIG